MAKSIINCSIKLIAVLNNNQNDKFQKAFEEMGWQMKSEAYHPKHNSTLFLYVKVIVFTKPKSIYK